MSDQPPPRDGTAGAPALGSGGGGESGDVPSTSPAPAPPPPPSGPAPGTARPPYRQVPPYGPPPHALVALLVYGAASSATGFTLATSGVGVRLVATGAVSGLVSLAYFALLDGRPKGRTADQTALGIAVVDDGSGGPIGVVRAGVRILVRRATIAVSWLPVPDLLADVDVVVAGLPPLWDPRHRDVHDGVRHTLNEWVR